MKLAQGSISWILTPFIIGLLLLVLCILFFEPLKSILLFFGFISFLLCLFFLVFFRDPDRKSSTGIVAVADGKIREVKTVDDNDVGHSYVVSTFMNVYNVHVNRMPISGLIKKIHHIPGSYIPAFKKESEKNERLVIIVEASIGLIKIVLIAGTLARRIVPYIRAVSYTHLRAHET